MFGKSNPSFFRVFLDDRISILDSWIPRRHRLITVARDGICKIWEVKSNSDAFDLVNLSSFQPFDGIPVTAISLCERSIATNESYYIAVIGSEEGKLQVWKLDDENDAKETILEVPLPFCHGKAIKRLAWRNQRSVETSSERKIFEFASCGEDNSVRIHEFVL
jgi:WD40 repeat protein